MCYQLQIAGSMSLYYKFNTGIPLAPQFPIGDLKNFLYTNGLHPLYQQTGYLGVLDPGSVV
jgi:hypothetical protein